MAMTTRDHRRKHAHGILKRAGYASGGNIQSASDNPTTAWNDKLYTDQSSSSGDDFDPSASPMKMDQDVSTDIKRTGKPPAVDYRELPGFPKEQKSKGKTVPT